MRFLPHFSTKFIYDITVEVNLGVNLGEILPISNLKHWPGGTYKSILCIVANFLKMLLFLQFDLLFFGLGSEVLASVSDSESLSAARGCSFRPVMLEIIRNIASDVSSLRQFLTDSGSVDTSAVSTFLQKICYKIPLYNLMCV